MKAGQRCIADLLEMGASLKTGPFGTMLKADQYTAEGVPLISVGEIGDGEIVLRGGTPRVGPDVVRELPEYLLEAHDIVFARKGSVDRVALVKDRETGYFLGSDGLRLRVGPSANARFLALQLRDPRSRAWLLQHASGSTLLSLNQETIKRIPIALPDRAQQDAIAEVLGALDDKIAANAHLVAIGRAMVGAMLEEALAVNPETLILESVAEFNNNRRVPLSATEREARVGPIPYWGANGVLGHVDVPLFDEPLVLVGEDGSVITDTCGPVVHYVWGPVWVSNHAHVLTGKGISTELLYYLIARANVAHLITGAVQPQTSGSS